MAAEEKRAMPDESRRSRAALRERFISTPDKYQAFIDSLFKNRNGVIDQLENNEPTLTQLDIIRKKTEHVEEIVNLVARNTNLVSFSIGGGGVRGPGLAALCRAIRQNKTLQRVDAVIRSLNSIEEIADVAESFGNARHITDMRLAFDSLRETQVLQDSGVSMVCERLSLHAELVSFAFHGARISGLGGAAITRMNRANPELVSLGLSNCSIHELSVMQSISEILSMRNTTIKSLDLSNNAIGDEMVTCLAAALKTNHTLTSLNLSRNAIRKEGIVALADAMEVNDTLIDLNISENRQPGVNGMQYVGLAKLVKALVKNTTLEALRMSKMRFCEQGIPLLQNLISNNHTIKSLYLEENILKDVGMVKLCRLLEDNDTLTFINVFGNKFGEAGASAVAKMLLKNSTLESLLMGGAPQTDAKFAAKMGPGVTAIIEALKQNSTLRCASLVRCGLQDCDAKVLAEVVECNKTLVEIDVRHNHISDAMCAEIARSLLSNSRLEVLLLNGHSLKTAGALAFAEAIRSSQILRRLHLRTSPVRATFRLEQSAVDELMRAVESNETLQEFTMDCSLEEENRIALVVKRNENILRRRFGERIAEICEKDHHQFLPTEVGFLMTFFCF